MEDVIHNNIHEGPSLRIESSAIINLRGVSTKLNKYIIFTMQTYKKLIVASCFQQPYNFLVLASLLDFLTNIFAIIMSRKVHKNMETCRVATEWLLLFCDWTMNLYHFCAHCLPYVDFIPYVS